MIATRSIFPIFPHERIRQRDRIPRNRLPITPEQRQSRDSLFERAVTMEEYFAKPRARSLREELADSRQEVERLRQELAVARYRNHEHSQLGTVLVEVIGRIVEISQGLFPGPISLKHSYDPENPSDEWLVFDVTAKGEFKDYRDREFQWHEEVEKIFPGTLSEFRLCVMPQR
jgi:hypothetical protein